VLFRSEVLEQYRDLYDALEKQHSVLCGTKNSVMAEITDFIDKDYERSLVAYREELAEYNAKLDEYSIPYNTMVQSYAQEKAAAAEEYIQQKKNAEVEYKKQLTIVTSQLEQRRNNLKSQAAKLKIFIPSQLRELQQELSE